MHHALAMDADVRLLEGGDPLSAPPTDGKQREGVARKLLEDWIVVSP